MLFNLLPKTKKKLSFLIFVASEFILIARVSFRFSVQKINIDGVINIEKVEGISCFFNFITTQLDKNSHHEPF